MLTNAFVGDREIAGSIRFNLVNKPKVKIARMAGQLSVSSNFGEFDGNQMASIDARVGER